MRLAQANDVAAAPLMPFIKRPIEPRDLPFRDRDGQHELASVTLGDEVIFSRLIDRGFVDNGTQCLTHSQSPDSQYAEQRTVKARNINRAKLIFVSRPSFVDSTNGGNRPPPAMISGEGGAAASSGRVRGTLRTRTGPSSHVGTRAL